MGCNIKWKKGSEPDYYFHNEIWGGSIIFKNLDSNSIPDFMTKATYFCNHKLWGNLGCTVLIKPKTEKKHSKWFKELNEILGNSSGQFCNSDYGPIMKERNFYIC